MQLPIRPISGVHGFDRGVPVDRYYIEIFLKEYSRFVQGDVAEIKDDTYACRFGAERLCSTVIIDVDIANPRVSIVADLGQSGSLPTAAFDCIICTQTLQFIVDPSIALRNFWQALRPNGRLLLTAPAVGRLSVSIPELDYWRFTPPGLRQLFGHWQGVTDFREFGNLRACLAMLLGEAAEELTSSELDMYDPAFPLLACVSARRP